MSPVMYILGHSIIHCTDVYTFQNQQDILLSWTATTEAITFAGA